jgi:branched-chain amino acid aminotransferase
MAGYDNRDGKIWMDGSLVDWREANVHILTHAMHYASSVFEGERAYNGKIFKSRAHSERLIQSGKLIDFDIPYSVDEIEAAKQSALDANGLTDAYVRAVAWRGAGEDMGVASARNPVHMAVAVWSWGNYYGDAKMKGAKLDIAKWRRPDPATAPSQAKAAGLYMIATMSKHAAEAKGCSDAMMYDYRGYIAEAYRGQYLFRQGWRSAHPNAGFVSQWIDPSNGDRNAQTARYHGERASYHARRIRGFRAVLVDRNRRRSYAGRTNRGV